MSADPSGGDALADALRAHADCPGHLDVASGAEPGAVVLSCEGCGASVEYSTGPTNGPQPHETHRNVASAAAHAVAVPSGSFGARYGRDHSSKVGSRRRTLRNATIVMAIVVVVFGATVILSPPESVPVGDSAPTQTSATTPAAGAGETVTVDDAFVVAVPPGWALEERDGASVISAPGVGPKVRVLYERGSASATEVAAGAADLLQTRHPEAEITTTEGDDGAVLLEATYPDGVERASVTADGELGLMRIVEVPQGSSEDEVLIATGIALTVAAAG